MSHTLGPAVCILNPSNGIHNHRICSPGWRTCWVQLPPAAYCSDHAIARSYTTLGRPRRCKLQFNLKKKHRKALRAHTWKTLQGTTNSPKISSGPVGLNTFSFYLNRHMQTVVSKIWISIYYLLCQEEQLCNIDLKGTEDGHQTNYHSHHKLSCKVYHQTMLKPVLWICKIILSRHCLRMTKRLLLPFLVQSLWRPNAKKLIQLTRSHTLLQQHCSLKVIM